MANPTEDLVVQTFEVWSVSHEGFAELATQRKWMGPTDMEQYQPTTADIFVRYADYERLLADKKRLDWLECQAVNNQDGILLHDGSKVTGRTGLGIWSPTRTLRVAVDQAMGSDHE